MKPSFLVRSVVGSRFESLPTANTLKGSGMRMIIRQAFIALAFCVPYLAQAQQNCPAAEEAIAAWVNSDAFHNYMTRSGLNADHQRLLFATFDHSAADWKFLAMSRGRREKRKPDDHEIPPFESTDLKSRNAIYVKGVPDIRAAGSEKVVFVLANTNVALYSVTKTITREDVPELAKLKQIIAGFAGIAKDVVEHAAAAGTTLQSQPDDIRRTETFPKEALERLRHAAVALAKSVDALSEDKQEIVSTLQMAEFSQSARPLALTDYQAHLPRVLTEVQEFQSSVAALRGDVFVKQHSCVPVTAIMKKANFEGLSLPEAQAHVATLLRELSIVTCDSRDAIDGASAILGTNEQPLVTIYLANAAFVEAIEKWATDTLTSTSDLIKNAAAFAQFSAEYKRANPTNDPCALQAGILIADTPDDVRLDQIGNATVTISNVSPLAATYFRRPNSSGDQKYRLAHRSSSSLAYGVGIVYTPLNEPSFSPIENPLNKDEKVIAKTSQKSRTGELALLASYRWGSEGTPFRPGFQFGIGLTDKTPVFAGFSSDLSRYIRIGVGVTGQRVTQLAEGYRFLRRNADGTVDPTSISKLGANDKVPTREGLTTRLYATIVITLDSIPFFQKTAGQ